MARGGAALGRQGQLDSAAEGVMTPCLPPQEGQGGSAGKADHRPGRRLCCLGRSGAPGTEVGVGSTEPPGTDPPLPMCQIPSHLHSSGGDGSGRRGRRASLGKLRPSLHLTMSFPTCAAQSGLDSAFSSHTNQIFYWVDAEQSSSSHHHPRGNWMITVVKLVLCCQAGASPATKVRLFHDPNPTAEQAEAP